MKSTRSQRPWRDAMLIVVPALIAGPPIGGFVMGLAYGVMAVFLIVRSALFGGDDINHAPGFLQLIMMPFLFAFWSYLFGAIPAVVSAVIISLHSWWSQEMNFRMIAGWIVVVSIANAAFLLMGDEWQLEWGVIVAALMFTGCGLVSGWVLFRLFRKEISVWRG